MARLAILVRIALANLVSSFLNVFIGAILAFGTALLVIGGSLFSTLDQSLSRSIVGSVTGHLQVYAARSKNALEVYGKVDGSDSALSPLDDFKGLKALAPGHAQRGQGGAHGCLHGAAQRGQHRGHHPGEAPGPLPRPAMT